jgi:hypothetical protein
MTTAEVIHANGIRVYKELLISFAKQSSSRITLSLYSLKFSKPSASGRSGSDGVNRSNPQQTA